MNAGLLVDLPSMEDAGADGVGLFRTELQFMVAAAFPRMQEQHLLYSKVLDAAGGKPVTFRSLDIGGDKVLPYLRLAQEENPAMVGALFASGWIARACCAPRSGQCCMLGQGAHYASCSRWWRTFLSSGRHEIMWNAS